MKWLNTIAWLSADTSLEIRVREWLLRPFV